MKRIVMTFIFLAGLTGCISFMAMPVEEKDGDGTKGALPVRNDRTTLAPSSVRLPSNPTWVAHPDNNFTPPRPAPDLPSTRATTIMACNSPRPDPATSLTPTVTAPRSVPTGLAPVTAQTPATAPECGAPSADGAYPGWPATGQVSSTGALLPLVISSQVVAGAPTRHDS